jgi:pseudouridine synthase
VPESRERIAKVLAGLGVASRREAERMVRDGLVEVNGEILTDVATGVDPENDRIKVDGKPIPPAARRAYYLLYKPKGYIVSRADPGARRSVMELLPDLPARVEPVGRLDINTEGALILTNDGDLAHALTHPSRGVPKHYLAKVYRTPNERTLERIAAGIPLDDGPTAPCKVRVVKTTERDNAWVEITVTEGRNRLIRRIFAAVGHPVSKLTRLSFATISVRGLEPGQFRMLTAVEVRRLRDVAEGTPASAAGRKSRPRKAGFARADPAWLKKRGAGVRKG